MSTIVAQICIRRDTAANFISANPTLALGEIAYETNTRNIKVGDGATAWTALGYINPYRGGTAAAPTSNTVLGSGAGAAMQAGAEDNVLIGLNAGNNITTADGNVFIGKDVGNQTTGSNSVAIGQEAMANSGTAAFNSIGIGYRALWQATGGGNVAIGHNADAGSGSFSNVVAVGNGAAILNTASDITAVGATALDANTTGTSNTAVGKDALGANTTGIGNTAVGNQALPANTIGIGNCAFGLNASQAEVDGQNNVAVGLNTFQAKTTGSNNVALGAECGRFRGAGSDTLTSASSSVFIGHQARAAANSETNQVVIAGTNGLGNGSNTTTIGNSSTTATHLVGTATSVVVASGDTVRIVNAKTPATAGAAGTAGDICWDANYIYVCVAANTWKRAAIATWP